nr:FAD-dependent oxidoreductase [Brevibacillus dissolubilis]
MLEQMQTITYDLLVIGGGITGAGIALDAATRGMKTALIEMQDFAAGTSSRSTKLVHGGLRYLKQFEVGMVAEVGKERAIVYENGPHVTTPEWMLLPIHQGGTFGKFSTSVGLRVYDYLAGVKSQERRQMLNIQTTLAKEPLLKQQGLLGGGYYVEYRTDDARLTIEVMKAAVSHGATAINYAKAEELLYDHGLITGVLVKDMFDGKTYQVNAKKIVNATGPWVDKLRELDGSKKGKTLQLTKGIHLVIDRKRFPLQQAIYFDTPDKRMVFAIPRGEKTYVGTTDTFFQEDTSHPRMTKADRQYVLDAINFMFPTVKITEADVESSWAGVRPLISEEGKSASEISRKDEIWQSPSGLITIAGGKLTGYRKMAEMVVDLVSKLLAEAGQGHFSPCRTKHLPISGGDVGGSAYYEAFVARKTKEGISYGLTSQQAEKLVRLYGSNTEEVYRYLPSNQKNKAQQREGGKVDTHGLPADLYASLIYAIESEMTVKPIDFFIRRTGALFFDIAWVQTWKLPVIDFMSHYLNWTQSEREAHLRELDMHLYDAVVPQDESNRFSNAM